MKNKIIYAASVISFIIALLCFIISAKAQINVVNNSATIGVLAGTTVFINGNLTQQAGATINNEGTITLTRDFTNNAGNNCFGASTGLVNLTGGVQQIGGTSVTAFNDLALLGTGDKRLAADIIVGSATIGGSGVLNLGNRNLDLNSNTLIINNNITTAYTRISGFIQSETDAVAGYGAIQWQIGNAGSGNYEFPFGNISTASYLPYNFAIVSPGVLSGAGFVSVATYPTNPAASPNNRSLPIGVTNLNNAFNLDNSSKVIDRYWILDVDKYSTKPTANLSMTYRDSEHQATGGSTNVIIESQLRAQRWDGAQWLLQTGSVNTLTNKAVVLAENKFNDVWTLSASSSPLPIELLSFNAKLNANKKVDLSWATASEINNDYFTMERSEDGISFETLGTVDGAGNSISNLYYSGLDANPFNGTSYYRLKQTDFDGKFTYSQIVPIDLSKETSALATVNIYPNPSVDFVNIQVSDEKINPNTTVEIFNAIGQVVFKNTIGSLNTNGNNVYQVSTGSFSPGFYMVKMMNGDEVVGSQKLIKK